MNIVRSSNQSCFFYTPRRSVKVSITYMPWASLSVITQLFLFSLFFKKIYIADDNFVRHFKVLKFYIHQRQNCKNLQHVLQGLQSDNKVLNWLSKVYVQTMVAVYKYQGRKKHNLNIIKNSFTLTPFQRKVFDQKEIL